MKNLYSRSISMMSFLLIVSASGEEYTNPQNGQNNNQKGNLTIGKDIPQTAKTNRYLYPAIQRDRIESNTVIEYDKYRDMQVKDDARKRVLDGTYGTSISMKPDVRLLRDIDAIKLSPTYITEINLPPSMTITDAKASFPINEAKFAKNSMKVQPKRDFYSGNISLYFTDGKRNYYMSIIADRYFQTRGEVEEFLSVMKKISPSVAKDIELKKNDGKYKDYKFSKEHLSLIIRYILPNVLSPEDAIMIYERMTHKKGVDIEDGDYVSFMYDGVTYKIIRDDNQGTLVYGKKAFIVENSLQQ